MRSSRAPDILSAKIRDTPMGLQGVALRVVGLVIGRDAAVADELAGRRWQLHLGE